MVERYTIPVAALKSELEARVRYALKSIIEFFLKSCRKNEKVGETYQVLRKRERRKAYGQKKGEHKKANIVTKFMSSEKKQNVCNTGFGFRTKENLKFENSENPGPINLLRYSQELLTF